MAVDADIETAVRAKLQSLSVTAYIYRQDNWDDLSYPATVYEITSDRPMDLHQEGSGRQEAILQVDVLAETIAEVASAMKQYTVALSGTRVNLGVGGFTDVCVYDEGMNLNTIFENDSLNKKVYLRGRAFRIIY